MPENGKIIKFVNFVCKTFGGQTFLVVKNVWRSTFLGSQSIFEKWDYEYTDKLTWSLLELHLYPKRGGRGT